MTNRITQYCEIPAGIRVDLARDHLKFCDVMYQIFFQAGDGNDPVYDVLHQLHISALEVLRDEQSPQEW